MKQASQKVVGLFDQIFALFTAQGWSQAAAIEELPDTGSSINDLTDEWGQEEWKSGPDGYNAAKGLKILVEKEGTQPTFSDEERVGVLALAREAMKLFFGSSLPNMESF